jgi:type VI secretion system protein ImpL
MIIGPREAGKSAVLRELAPPPTEPLPSGAGSGIEWRFLDGGAVLEIPGDFLFGPDGREARDSSWNRLLQTLAWHRPSRPIDGIVLALPAGELLAVRDDSELARQSARAVVVRAKLDQLQRVLGFVVPVYILVTKCEEINGFASFCGAAGTEFNQDIFGWSNPHLLDTAFVTEWVDEAISEVQSTLEARVVRLLAGRSGLRAPDELFLFPLHFEPLREPLRRWLAELFRQTSYRDSNFFRGLYFCGDTRPEARTAGEERLPALPSSLSAIAFVRHLFDLKIFPEFRSARPVGRSLLSHNRAVIAAQVALAIIILVFGLGTGFGYYRLRNLRDSYLPLLKKLQQDVVPDATRAQADVAGAYTMVEFLGEVNVKGFRSFFFPASWSDPVDGRMIAVLKNQFRPMVFQPLKAWLDDRAQALLGCRCDTDTCEHGSDPVTELAQCKYTADTASIGTSLATFRKNQDLLKFATNLGQLRLAFRHYENLTQKQSGTYGDLSWLFQYMIGRNLSSYKLRFQGNQYYEEALKSAEGDPLQAGACLTSAGKKRTLQLATAFLGDWLYCDNPVLASTAAIAENTTALERGSMRLQDVPAFTRDIRRLDDWLGNGGYDWLSRPAFDRAAYPVLGKPMLLVGFDPSDYLTVDNYGETYFEELKEALSNIQTPVRILEIGGTGVKVSYELLKMAQVLESLTVQEFAVGTAQSLLPAGSPFLGKEVLTKLSSLQAGYLKFSADQLSVLPDSARAIVNRLALRTLGDTMRSVLDQSRAAGGFTAASDGTVLLEHIRMLKESAPVAAKVQVDPAGSGLRLDSLIEQEARSLTDGLSALFEQHKPYAPPALANRLNQLFVPATPAPARPASLAMYDAASPEDLAGFVSEERDRAHSLAVDYADPLVAFYQSRKLPLPAALQPWPDFIQDVKDVDAKRPSAAILQLENVILSGLDKVTPEAGCPAPPFTFRSGDYFLTLAGNLRRSILERCAARSYTQDLAGYFNDNLAGRFPFGPIPGSAQVPQARPGEVAELLSRLEPRVPSLLDYFQRDEPVREFLTRTSAVKTMFAGGFTEGTPYVDFQVQFRVNRSNEVGGNQIIDWSLESGDQTLTNRSAPAAVRWRYNTPVRVSLRFAGNSPNIPIAGAAADGQVKDRTVTFEYDGPWALFTLLNRHTLMAPDTAAGAAPPNTLRFVIPSAPASAPSQVTDTRVYLRITFQVPGGKEPKEVDIVPFPSSAPLPARTTVANR